MNSERTLNKLTRASPERDVLEYVFIDSDSFANYKVKIDSDYMYFFNKSEIKFVKIKDLHYNYTFEDFATNIALTIDEEEMDNLYIKDIKCSLRNSHDQATDY